MKRPPFLVRLAGIVFALTAVAACAARSGAAVQPGAADSLAHLDALYSAAIRQSAVVTPDDVLPLRPLVAGPGGTVTMTTWASCRGEGGANKCGSYAPGPVTLRWDAWVVADEEFASACRRLQGDIDLGISQLLGMPAPRAPMSPGGFDRQFVTFSAVPIAKVFRPCTDPRVDTDRCSTALPASLPANAPADFYRWFTNQAMSSWQIPAKGAAPDGFPWTRLGYTYNWNPQSPTRYGVSEYVLPGSAGPIDVTVLSVRTAQDYCGAAGTSGR
jgi:hypothetical protein